MTLTTDLLFAIIGSKEAELVLLKQEVARLQHELQLKSKEDAVKAE